LLVAAALCAAPAHAAAKIKAVASFSILGDIAHEIGGDRVEVATLVGPDSDVHVYEPTPRDAKAVAEAQIFVVNGLGLEGWTARLIDSAHFRGALVETTKGITPRRMTENEGAGPAAAAAGGPREVIDPHAWQSLANGKIYAANIRDGLIAADPEGRAVYEANAARFSAEIDRVDAEIRAQLSRLPPERRRIITSHDAFGYFGAAYGLDFIAPEGVTTDSEPSAQDVARIVRQVKTNKIPAVFMENITDHRLLDQIAHDTGAKIGGALYSDALSQPGGPAGTYLAMFRHNVATLTAALAP
jgi:zinc/manganese transport system substrate-binding protein